MCIYRNANKGQENMQSNMINKLNRMRYIYMYRHENISKRGHKLKKKK